MLNKKNLLKEDFVSEISKDDKSTGKEKVSEDNEKIQKSEEKVVSSGISGPVDLNSTKKN